MSYFVFFPDVGKAKSVANASLIKANKAKNDEFYTQLKDIESELKHYKNQLKDKVIFCNCDDPFESNFFKYFAMNFKALGLKKLITTCYDPSPIANKEIQLSFFGEEKEAKHSNKSRQKIISKAYKIELDDISDIDGSGNINILDTKEILLREKAKLDNGGKSKILSYLKGDGDFRSDECIELLKQSDIVVTNPPFSLFREYIAQLIEYDKKFLIIGNKNAISFKDVFSYFKHNQVWYGYSSPNEFILPGNIITKRVNGLARWFTNLDTIKRHEELVLFKKYNPEEYPKYANYDAIEVSKVAEIPEDYYGEMGVPITFLDKHNPEQFEIIGSSRNLGKKMSECGFSKETYISGGVRFYLPVKIEIRAISYEDEPLARYRFKCLYDRIVIKRKAKE